MCSTASEQAGWDWEKLCDGKPIAEYEDYPTREEKMKIEWPPENS